MSHYASLAVNVLVGFVIMYLVMFAMIAEGTDFYHNLNMAYMAAMMAAPMGPLMLVTMPAMYRNRTLNVALHIGFALVFVGSFYFIRAQTFVGDLQFVRSMIPHHSGAILMCREAVLSDDELRSLCGAIIDSQQQEIDQMRNILERL